MKRLKPVPTILLLAALALPTVGCRTGRDYPDPAGPRYAGTAQPDTLAGAGGDTLRVVSFNIEFSMDVPRGVRVLREHQALRSADIILLQEMDASGAKMVADSLRMHHVYYPAIYNRLARKDFGNAILSRWPMAEDAKLILPSRSRYAKTQRIATAATIRVRGRAVRAYSTHLGTPADLGHEGRVAQLGFIMADAAPYQHVVLGGDMNSLDMGKVARAAGFATPTESIPPSSSAGRLDHIFLKGLLPAGTRPAGTADISPAISDHRPIWVTVVPAR